MAGARGAVLTAWRGKLPGSAAWRLSLYHQKTRLTMENRSSRGFAVVIVEHSAEFIAAADGRPRGLVLGKVHFLATRTRNQRRVSGVTRVANFPRRRRPTSLALRASRMRWASVKHLGLPPSCSRRMRFSSWRYSITACWCRLIQPATAISSNWSCVVTEWRIFQKSLWLNPPSDLG